MKLPLPRATALLAVLLLGTPAPAAEAPPEPLKIEDFFSTPALRQPRLSPDGTKIAFLFPHEKKLALGLFDRATKESRMILRGADESLARFFWKGNDRIIFEADVSGNESFFIGSTDLTGKTVVRLAESQRLQNNLTGDFAGIVDHLPSDPERLGVIGIFAGNIDQATFVGTAPTVGLLNVRNGGRSTLVELRESDRFKDWHFDHRGALRLRSRLEGKQIIWEHRDDNSARFRAVATHPFHGYAETWDPQAFAADNTTLWLISREEHDRGALYALDTRTFERGPALFVPPEGEIAQLIVSHDRARLLGVRYEAARERYHWFDAARGALQAKLAATFTGCDIRTVSTSRDGSVEIIWVGHDREPGVYYILDQKDGSLTQFKRIANIDPARFQPMQPIRYTARDGLEIHGYLTVPRGLEGKKIPLVVHPHGGPFGVRDSWGFDRDVQFLASRGYAVLQPNYRGSGGYGRDFINKGRQQWGRAMQDDLTDGVKWAIAQGIADPKRIAIYGASYGGYAALAGAMLTPDLYACAVNYVGASDLEITFWSPGEDAWRDRDEFSYRTEWVGPDRAYRDATSPILLVDRLKIPTLHAYGAEDPRVKINHWTRLEPQLKKYGADYQVIVEGKQGHGFRNENESLSFAAALERFLDAHLKNPHVTIGPTKVVEPAKK
ncbi:MAG: alpha/beta fold hydrolase [Opitutaceae bacterium]|nr:alpha/beta fold hydrolase [Opitutaceae bacterium]